MNHKDLITKHLQERRRVYDRNVDEYVARYKKEIQDKIIKINPLTVHEGINKLIGVKIYEPNKKEKCDALHKISENFTFEGYPIYYHEHNSRIDDERHLYPSFMNKCEVFIRTNSG